MRYQRCACRPKHLEQIMRRRKSVLGTLIFLLCLVAMTDAFSTAAFAQAATPSEKVTLRLDWKPAAQHAPFYYGKAKGYYAQEGIDLSIIPGSGSPDALKQAGSGAVNFAIVDAIVLAQGLEQRVPVKSVAIYFQNTPVSLLSPQSKPVTDVKHLTTGIKVGRRKASATYVGLLALLAANGIKPEQVNMVDIGFGVQPLLVKLIDAMIGSTITDPIEAEDAGMPVYEMLIAEHGVNVYGFTIAVNNELIARSGNLVTRFLSATKKAAQDVRADKEYSIAALANAADEIDRAREMKVLDRTLRFLTSAETNAHGFGWQSEERWQQTIDTAKSLRLIERAPAAKDAFTNAFLN
jgi:NitT/TauT family transport system substrate-binding protein